MTFVKVFELASGYSGGEVKMEVEEESEDVSAENQEDRGVTLDATMEYCRNIGELV